MGMAASQARLLMITSRLHDVELRAQQLQNAKLLLATQEDEAYEEYQKALDATKFTANMINAITGEESLTPMTFNSLFSMAGATGDIRPSGMGDNAAYMNYLLIDKNGRVVVEDDLYDRLEEFNSYAGLGNWYSSGCNGILDNAYAFATFMTQGDFFGYESGQWNNNISKNFGIICNNNYSTDETLAGYIDAAVAALTNMADRYRHQVGDDSSNPGLVGLLGTSAASPLSQSAWRALGYEGSFKGMTNPVTNTWQYVPKNWTIDSTGNYRRLHEFTFGQGHDHDYSNGLQYDRDLNGRTLFDYICQYANGGDGFAAATDEQKAAFDDLINYVFNNREYRSQILTDELQETNPHMNSSEFNYYVRLYEAIQQHGGCVKISDYDGPAGPAATNNDWLTAMLQSGLMTIETVSQNPGTGDITCSGITVASEPSLSYTATTSIDKVALAHAEAEYEHKLRVIDKKEQKIDRDLNKIETERNALTKQYDSIKKVSDDNIDRTFGIFS